MSDSTARKGPVMLAILDGWGLRDEEHYNAIRLAATPNYDRLTATYPFTRLATSGTDVGLPRNTMGNSEVGHLNIGAGRIVWQELMRINNAIADLSFFENEALLGAIQQARQGDVRLHLFGLVSSAFVHSCEEHYFALIRMARQCGLRREQVIFHIFTDGRDTSPRSGSEAVSALQRKLDLYDTGIVGSVTGRYYAMDRDRRWQRTRLAYEAMVQGRADHSARTALEAVQSAYQRADTHSADSGYPAETDEFIRPTVIVDPHGDPVGTIADGDVMISFNHRSDRPRQIIRALVEQDFEQKTADAPHPSFERESPPQVYLVTLTDYRANFDCPVAFDSTPLSATLGELVSRAGLKQFHTAETEKYPHVTFFCNGGREKPFPGEERFMAPSPQVATYDLKPEMSAKEVTDNVIRHMERGDSDLIILNFANCDMVGHTGVLEAAIQACETVDSMVGRIAETILQKNGDLLITADHGNCEQMWDDATNGPHTAHTTNPVPCFLVSRRFQNDRLRSGGRLADLAPTLLALLGLEQPSQMDGRSLLERG